MEEERVLKRERESYIPENQFSFEERLKKPKQKEYLSRVANYQTKGKLLNAKLIKEWIVGAPSNPFFVENRNKKRIEVKDIEYYALIDSIIPATNYDYREISLNDFEHNCQRYDEYSLRRASFIPLVNIEGQRYWLLGNFHDYANTDNPILMDFGGRCENIDKKQTCPAITCAARELLEESHHLLYNIILDVFNRNDKDKIAIFEGRNEKNKEKVYFFVVELPYESVKDIPAIFDEINISILRRQREREYNYPKIKKEEKLGPLHFYLQSDIKKRKYRTSKNLTDFVSYLNKYKY